MLKYPPFHCAFLYNFDMVILFVNIFSKNQLRIFHNLERHFKPNFLCSLLPYELSVTNLSDKPSSAMVVAGIGIHQNFRSSLQRWDVRLLCFLSLQCYLEVHMSFLKKIMFENIESYKSMVFYFYLKEPVLVHKNVELTWRLAISGVHKYTIIRLIPPFLIFFVHFS